MEEIINKLKKMNCSVYTNSYGISFIDHSLLIQPVMLYRKDDGMLIVNELEDKLLQLHDEENKKQTINDSRGINIQQRI